MNVIAVSGGTGFIGRNLVRELGKKYKIVLIERGDFNLNQNTFNEKLMKADVIINLAGEPILRRWTKKNRRLIYDSRIQTTRKIAGFLNHDASKERMFINISAIGLYSADRINKESDYSLSTGFISELIKDWEGTALTAVNDYTRVTLLRLGVVLDKNGGLVKMMLPFFRMGLGGRIGNGEQYMSFIHMDDVIGIVQFLLINNKYGIFNVTTPYPVKNREFTDLMGKLLKRKVLLTIPEGLIKLIYGKGSVVILGGHYVLPENLISEGYVFKYETCKEVLSGILE